MTNVGNEEVDDIDLFSGTRFMSLESFRELNGSPFFQNPEDIPGPGVIRIKDGIAEYLSAE